MESQTSAVSRRKEELGNVCSSSTRLGREHQITILTVHTDTCRCAYMYMSRRRYIPLAESPAQSPIWLNSIRLFIWPTACLVSYIHTCLLACLLACLSLRAGIIRYWLLLHPQCRGGGQTRLLGDAPRYRRPLAPSASRLVIDHGLAASVRPQPLPLHHRPSLRLLCRLVSCLAMSRRRLRANKYHGHTRLPTAARRLFGARARDCHARPELGGN